MAEHDERPLAAIGVTYPRPPEPTWLNGQQHGKLWAFYEGGSPADEPPSNWRELVGAQLHPGHRDDMIFDVHPVACPGCDELVKAARTEHGCCPACGSRGDYQAHTSSAFGGADITWPSCDACGWQGEP